MTIDLCRCSVARYSWETTLYVSVGTCSLQAGTRIYQPTDRFSLNIELMSKEQTTMSL